MDFEQLGTQFKIFAIVESVIGFLVALFGNFIVSETERGYIWVFTGVYLVFNNLSLFYGYIFQAVNKTKIFSKSVILDRVCVLVFIIVLFIKEEKSFLPYIITYTLSKCAAFFYLYYQGREIAFAKQIPIGMAIRDMRISFSCGIKLTIANIMSMLILGIGRVLLDRTWGIETFGKISLALSLSNFFLVFIQQVSMVLFPALRRIDESQLTTVYNKLRIVLNIGLPVVFLCYYPIKAVVGLWLPQYSESLKYLALLLPVCIFDGKMQMLYNTYLKVLRQEKKLLQLNIIAFITSLFLCFISTYGLKSITYVVLSMVISIIFRSVLSERYISNILNVNTGKTLIQEIIITIIFLYTSWFLEEKIAFTIIILVYSFYVAVNSKEIYFNIVKK